MNPFKRLAAWLGRKKQKAHGGAPALTGPRYYHPFDLNSMTCRRCGVSYVVAAKVPCKSAPPVTRRPTPLDAIEHHEAPPTIHTHLTPIDSNAWTDAFGPLSSTFRVPEASPEETFAGAGGTFGGAGASASWDTSPASVPSSSSIPDSDSPSSGSSSGSSDSDSSSSSSDSGSSDSSSDSGGDSGGNAD